MAILKHIASKNANYGSAIDYLKYQHDEFHLVPVLDESGNMLLREEFYLDGLNCNPETFDLECELLNQQYHKNNTYDEIKSHHYIISHDPRDNADHDLTGERAQAIGLEYAKANFPGHQALVCTHTDGNNGTGNIHTHIIINSLRKSDIEPQTYTERPIDCKAGYKHHLTKDYLKHLQKSLMDICQREGLHQVDLLSPAADKITQQEYHAQRRGQLNLDIANMELLGDGITPMHTTFETNKEKFRNAISDIAERATSFEEFQRLLKAEYGILVKDHRGRFSYLPADRQKFISARALGSNYDRDRLLRIFAENARNKERNNPHLAADDPLAILFIKSDLRLVVDLQTCVKAQQSHAYAQKVKISNLQQMARTVAYVQEHGYDSYEKLSDTTDTIQSKMAKARSDAKFTEAKLKKVNEQIRYLGQYLSTKSVYGDFLKSGNKKSFRQAHAEDIAKYEEALRILKQHSPDGKFPTMKDLRTEKEQLTIQKDAQYDTYHYFKDYHRELQTVCANVDNILGTEREARREQQQSRKNEHSL